MTITVNGHNDAVSYKASSTTSTIASALITAINGDGSAPVTAAAAGPGNITITSKVTGSSSNYPVSVSWTHSASFSAPSFTLSAPAALYGGQGGSSDPNAFSETYTIDPWGNQQESGSFNFVQPYSSNNQINAAGYTYDAAGDLKADALGNSYARVAHSSRFLA